jgi:hypothetical protein
MLPHIVFRSQGNYFPGPDFWRANISPHAPHLPTSGITQPAVHAIAALKIFQNSRNKNKAKEFLAQLFPKLLSFHNFLFTERDPEESGLITIFHPWESGFDNSVRWDDALNRVNVDKLPSYRRVDIQEVSPAERPTNDVYERFIYLIQMMKSYRYDNKLIYKNTPFKIKDIVFSSITYVANKALLEIADILGQPQSQIESWLGRTRKNYFEFFCPDRTKYRLVYDYDLITSQRIEKRTVASLLSLYTDLLSSDQAKTTVAWMKHSSSGCIKCTHRHPVIPSIDPHAREFNPLNYWRGPAWINTNWMLHKGLKKYGFHNEALLLKEAIYRLIEEHGFYEYYNPYSGEGLGAADFSWSASLLIDLLIDNTAQ